MQTLPPSPAPPLGAFPTTCGTVFRLWSSRAADAGVRLYDLRGTQSSRLVSLQPRGEGIFEAEIAGVEAGTRYRFELDGETLPDPYARWCPDGVHGPASVWTPTYTFQHPQPTLTRSELVIYELHIGTFTLEGTYRAAQQKLPYLKELGVTAIELMPLAAFPGERGWGYDGVTLFSPYAQYGTPEDLQAFIDAAHGLGLAVLLDLVLNHFGPDGNYLGAYSPAYFTGRHKTPWGDALDYGEPHMRRLVLDSVRHWLHTYRFDGLRLDATHEIYDEHQPHVLDEVAAQIADLRNEPGGAPFVFCEDDRNDPALVTRSGMDGLWADDFHHLVHVLLTGEQDGYYRAYRPEVATLARCIGRGWLYEGQPWPLADGAPRGRPADTLDASSMVYCLQNHDQIGNRAQGERLHVTASAEQFLAASALLLFLPMTPLLFQGQEWLASAHFQYFSDHAGELGAQITAGRLKEFQHFEAFSSATGEGTAHDPQSQAAFHSSVLDWNERQHGDHARALELYRRLLHLRRDDAVLRTSGRQHLQAGARGNLLWVTRRSDDSADGVRLLLVNFSPEPADVGDLTGSDATLLLGTSAQGSAALQTVPGHSAVLLALSTVPEALTPQKAPLRVHAATV